MRKQIDFDVISENIGSPAEKQVLLNRVHQYLEAGWEVIGTHVPQTGNNSITTTIFLGKYEEFADEVRKAKDSK